MLASPVAGAERELIHNAGFSPDGIGYLVFDLQAGEVVRSHQPHTSFIPASLVKLATVLAALEVLGPDHRFRTPVLAQPEADGLHLHLSGGGDPVFVQEHLSTLAGSLAKTIAGRPVGRFTFDEALLPSFPQIDPSDDGLKPYNPPISALSVNFNRQSLRWFRDEQSRVMRVMLRPSLDHALAGIAPAPMPDGRSIRAIDGLQTVYLLDPKVPSAGERQVTVRQPALRTAALLRHYAVRHGVLMPAPERLPVPPAGAEPLAAYQSRPLLEIAEDLLKYSNNLSAELVGLATARALQGDVPNLSDSAAVIRDWLVRTVPQAEGAEWGLENQSGLSGDARATPAAMLALLRYGADRRYPVPATLADAGAEQRPFLSLLREPLWGRNDADIRLFSKSGTMFYTRGQAGLFYGASGREMLFVLMHTDFEARRRYESNPMRFTAAVQTAARVWLGRARGLEYNLLRHWIDTL